MFLKPVFAVLFLFVSNLSFAQNPVAKVGNEVTHRVILSERQIDIFAKDAILDELNDLNPHLAKHETDVQGYHKRNLRRFYKTLQKYGIESDLPFETCILTSSNVKAIKSKTLSLANVQVTSQTKALAAIRESLGAPGWRLLSKVCVHAKKRFAQRLQNLTTKNGVPVTFDQDMIDNLANFIFVPTDKGKPSWKHSRQKAFDIFLGTVLLTNEIAAFLLIPGVGPVIGAALPVLSITNGTVGLKKHIEFTSNEFGDFEMDGISDQKIIFLDLNDQEKALWEKEKLKDKKALSTP